MKTVNNNTLIGSDLAQPSRTSKLRRIGLTLACGAMMALGLAGIANAQVNVTYQSFPTPANPTGQVLNGNKISSGCESSIADTYSGYEFLFWDNQGTISFNSTVDICVGSTSGVATAWYIETGGGGSCPPTCYLTTLAFSIDHNELLVSSTDPLVFGTPISLVTPNSPVVWAAPSNTVNTIYGPESISAASALAFPPYSAEPFRFWQQLGTSTETPIGGVYQATQNSTAWVIAFYGPDPCQPLRTELTVCLEELPAKACLPIGKALMICEENNREPY